MKPINYLTAAAVALIFIVMPLSVKSSAQASFVAVKNHQFYADGKPYYFIGTNYWYGGLLGLEKDKQKVSNGCGKNWIF